MDVHSHTFKVLTLVSEIHKKVVSVLGMKYIFELEGTINSRESCFSFLNRLIPSFLKAYVILKPNEQRFIKIETSFIEEISGLVIIKILDEKAQGTLMPKTRFVRN